MSARTLFEKIWDAHVVAPESVDTPAVLYIDLHLVHEVTSPQAFSELRSRGLKLRRPDRTLATLDHSTPTLPAAANGERPYANAEAKAQVAQLEANCREFGVQLYGWDSSDRGIVHVIGPELGATQPGMTIVCGDSHTSTHCAFGGHCGAITKHGYFARFSAVSNDRTPFFHCARLSSPRSPAPW